MTTAGSDSRSPMPCDSTSRSTLRGTVSPAIRSEIMKGAPTYAASGQIPRTRGTGTPLLRASSRTPASPLTGICCTAAGTIVATSSRVSLPNVASRSTFRRLAPAETPTTPETVKSLPNSSRR
ncbi:Uncharacterised protein [Mycobacteroides abscessus subsp. abscessus]|nr:Uncharacterised protein [Mycobacteroides abscessus subsp. abscessus]